MEEDKKECMLMAFWRRLTVGQGVFILFVFTATLIIKFWMVYGGWNEVRTIGDTKFDAMSALFSGLAFAGLICTILLQQFELKATREELHNSAQANRDAAEASRMSAEIAEKQIKAQYYSTIIPIKHANFIYEMKIMEDEIVERIKKGEGVNLVNYNKIRNKRMDSLNDDVKNFANIVGVTYPILTGKQD